MGLDGEPLLVGKDVALALGYTNPQKAIRDHVDDEDKTVNETFSVNGTPIVLINESGLYSLVLRSRKAEAKRSNAELCMWSSRPYARPVAAVPRCFRTLGIRRRPRGRGRIMRSSGFSKNGSASCWSRG